jgi:transposase-like protein
MRESLAMFSDEVSAHRYLERVLWPNGICCPRCGGGRVGELNGGSTRIGTYKCYKCRKVFSVLHGTLMSASHVPAHKWLQALWLTEGGTKPMRAYHLARILNVSFKTASSMMRRIAGATTPSADLDSADVPATPPTSRSAAQTASRWTA